MGSGSYLNLSANNPSCVACAYKTGKKTLARLLAARRGARILHVRSVNLEIKLAVVDPVEPEIFKNKELTPISCYSFTEEAVHALITTKIQQNVPITANYCVL